MTVFRLRDGLTPLLSGESTGDLRMTGFARPGYAISPDGQKVVVTNGAGGTGNFLYSDEGPTEQHIFPSAKTATANFNGAINAIAAGDEFFAVGGSTPFLYILDWSGNLQSVNVTGIAQVRNLAFSPDGLRLAVLHASAPYLRIYNTSDWSFVNVASGLGGASSNYNDLYFTGDGRLVVGSTVAPYLATVNLATGAILNSISSAVSLNSVSGLMKHPDSNQLIWVGSSSSSASKHIGVYDLDSYQLSLPFADIGTTIWSAVLDKVNREIIFLHSDALGRNCSIIKLDEPSVIHDPGDDIKSHVTGTPSPQGLVILERDIARINGTVRDIDNLPAARRVIAFHREGGYMAASTMSDPSTGDYELIVENTDLHDVQFRVEEGELLNDLFFARVEPEAV
ncbi:hypothetical protein vBPaeMUSP25_23 [Pseudomonas phage vB_PaeM_USP_25]|nr:hypothetical protein vBPaeMUSP25_23 [Pseudomonas phage vB_PaeM_USP_25]